MAETDAFANGANPFAAIGFAGGELAKSDDPFSAGRNPFAAMGFHKDAPEPAKATGTSMAANFAAGTNEGISGILGAPVDAANWAMGKVGLPVSDRPMMGSQWIRDQQARYGGSPDQIQANTAAERIARGVGSGVSSTLVPAAGAEALGAKGLSAITGGVDATNAAIGGMSGGGGQAAAEVVPDKYKPLAATVGGLAAAVPVVAGSAAIQGAKSLASKLPAVSAVGREAEAQATVGNEIRKNVPDAYSMGIHLDESPNLVPGSEGTLGQRVPAMAQWEDQVRTANKGPFIERAADQNAARVDSLEKLQPAGSSQDVSAHFRQMREQIANEAEAKVTAAQSNVAGKTAAIAPNAGSAEEAGAAIRGPAADALAARKAADDALYAKARIPDSATVPASPITEKVKSVQESLKPEDKPMGAEEKRLFDLAGSYGDEISFNRLKSLRSSILDEAANTRLSDPAAYRRLNQLRGSVEDAMDHAVENKVALDQVAVKRGTMAAEDTFEAKLQANVRKFQSDRKAAVASGGEGDGYGGGQRPSSAASVSGTASEGAGRPSGAASDQGVQGGTGTPGQSSTITPEQVAALKKANDSYREQRQTFGEGPIGDILEKKPRGADFSLSDAEVPKKIFHPGPTGGEDVRSYVAAVGKEKATPVLSDLASFMLHEKAFENGVPNPAKIEKWLSDHKAALAELPPQVRAKFSDAGKAQQAVDEALTARRQRLDDFDKTTAAKLAGLSDPKDISATVGNIFGRTDGVGAMKDIASKVKGNEAAENGLKAAVADHIMTKFLSTVEGGASGVPKLREVPFQKFVRDKMDVLKAAGFSDEQIGRLSAIVQDQQRAARSINNAKLAGQSTTAPDILAAARKNGTGSILSELANEHALPAIGAAAGAAAHGVGGGFVGWLGSKLYGSLREAGLTRMNELRVQAALNPDFALALLQKVPNGPDKGGAALVALRARQMAIAGANAYRRSEQ